MESTKQKAVSIANQIIEGHISRIKKMDPEGTGGFVSDSRPKRASTYVSYEPQTEEAYSEYLKNEIAVLLEIVLLLTGLLPYWKRIDVLADKKTTIPGVKKHPPREIKINIKLFAK